MPTITAVSCHAQAKGTPDTVEYNVFGVCTPSACGAIGVISTHVSHRQVEERRELLIRYLRARRGVYESYEDHLQYTNVRRVVHCLRLHSGTRRGSASQRSSAGPREPQALTAFAMKRAFCLCWCETIQRRAGVPSGTHASQLQTTVPLL